MIRTLALITFLLFQSTSGQDLSIENGWKGIEVFKTKSSDVERILDTRTSDSDRIFTIYSVPEGKVAVVFSDNPCTKSTGGKGDYDVPPNTVIEYSVSFLNSINLSELKWRKENYKVVRSSHRPDVFDYVDSKNGIWITVYSDNDMERVSSLWFRGSKQMRKTLECHDRLKTSQNRVQTSKTKREIEVKPAIRAT